MSRRKIQLSDLMQATERLLLEQGYGGFNFSALAKILGVGRTTLYEYYASKDDLIVAYMNELMDSYTNELTSIITQRDAKTQLFHLIELMIKYAHIHSILKIIPLLNNNSDAVVKLKSDFAIDHIHITQQIEAIIDHGKNTNVIRKEIPTDVMVNMLFNTINKPTSLEIDKKSWAKWVWEIIYKGMKIQS